MRPQTVTVQSATQSVPLQMDMYAGVMNVAFGCVISGGAVLTYKVQYTYDNIQDSTVTVTWFDHATVTGKTANADGNIQFPFKALRLNVTAFTSGSVTMTVLQSKQGPGSH